MKFLKTRLVLAGVLLLNSFSFGAVVQAPPKSGSLVPAIKAGQSFATAEITAFTYKKVAKLPEMVDETVSFSLSESIENEIKSKFSSSQSHSAVSKEIIPAIRRLLAIADEAVELLRAGREKTVKKIIKIKFKNEKDSAVAQLSFKKVDGAIVVSVEVLHLTTEEPEYLGNLLYAVLADDTFWQKHGMKVVGFLGLVGAFMLEELILGLVSKPVKAHFAAKKAERERLEKEKREAREKAEAERKKTEFKQKMAEMTEKISKSLAIFKNGSEDKAVGCAQESKALVQYAIGREPNNVGVITILDIEGLETFQDRVCTHLIIPAHIFEGGKKVRAEVAAMLQERAQNGLKIAVLDENARLTVDLTLSDEVAVGEPSAYAQQFLDFRKNSLNPYGLGDLDCWFVSSYVSEREEPGFMGIESTSAGKSAIYANYLMSFGAGYALACLFEIPGIDAGHSWTNEEGLAQLSPLHDHGVVAECEMCKKIDAVANIWGQEPFDRFDNPEVPKPAGSSTGSESEDGEGDGDESGMESDDSGKSGSTRSSRRSSSQKPTPPVDPLTAASLAEVLGVPVVVQMGIAYEKAYEGCAVLDMATYDPKGGNSIGIMKSFNGDRAVLVLFGVDEVPVIQDVIFGSTYTFLSYIQITCPDGSGKRSVKFKTNIASSSEEVSLDADGIVATVQGVLREHFRFVGSLPSATSTRM